MGVLAAQMTGLLLAIEPMTKRPVVTDPRRVRPPCVLIELPTLLASDRTACGRPRFEHTVLVIGLPGTWPELAELDGLLTELEGSLPYLTCEPVTYVPFNAAGDAEGVPAYRITLDLQQEDA